MLLYLIMHSRSGIANKTRELSNANNDASPAAFKELLHVIKYVLDTKKCFEVGTNWECHEPCEIVCFSDCDYEGDQVIRTSVSGFILCVY